MKVCIWGDMEGISCITRWGQVNAEDPLYTNEGRALYTEDINAAVRGAKRAGATEIVVVDGHGAGKDCSFNSLLKDRLEPGAHYVFGHRWGCYIAPFEAGCDALLLVGAHAMAGVPDGILCHTMSSASWYNAYIGNQPIGETGLAAAIAGSFGVPLVFVSGDAAVLREARLLLGANLAGAQVKIGCTRESAICLAPSDGRRLIEEEVLEVLSNRNEWGVPFVAATDADGYMRLRVDYLQPDRAEASIGRENCEVHGRTVTAKGRDFWQLWDSFFHH